MATKYSDIIELSKTRTVYSIREESPADWKTFIANDQFNTVLDTAVKAVLNNDAEKHKSLWIAGTYGTGKSHAAAVIKHLLCDPIDDIKDYIDVEYKDSKFDILRTNLTVLRQQKRLFPVNLYGQQSITHEEDLSLQIQREIKEALKKAGVDVTVRTDFDSYVNHIDQKPEFWEMLIEQSPKLKASVQDIKKLRSELASGEVGVLDKANEALRESRLDVRLEVENLCQWIFEVQNKLREANVADGLLIIWDEFTEIGKSAIGERILGRLQEIAETMMKEENDSYFLLISHPSALNLLSDEKRTQTLGRYHYMPYNMAQVSAFKIMSRKFNIVDDDAHQELVNEFYKAHSDLLDLYTAESNQKEDTKRDIEKLYPLHPATANLATFYAREAGSSSRSVFEFLACDAVKAFFDDEKAFADYRTITPDYLWDYVIGAFVEDSSKFGAVTERWNNFHNTVEKMGPSYSAVFKGILLLNALNNIAHHDTVTPSEDNIRHLFVGTEIEPVLTEILNYFNEKSIVQRLPDGIFSIQFAALPADEVEKHKGQLISGQYKYTDQVAKYADIANTELNKAWAGIARPFKIEVYSQQTNEFTLINKIENGYKQAKGYEIFIAVLIAKNFDELNFLKAVARSNSESGRLTNMLLAVFDATLEQPNYDRFIDFLANNLCAQSHGLLPQQEQSSDNAKKLVKDWINRIKSGNFTYFLNGEEDTCSASKFVSTVNNCVAPIIFNCGPESLPIILTKSSKTYWQKAAVKKAVDVILQFNTKEEIISKVGGQGKHVEYLLQDSVDSNLNWKDDVDPNHPLKKVCDYMDTVFKQTNKNQEFNLGEKLEALSKPPYGLFQSYAGMSMVAFGMRKYVKQIFDTSGKPRESRHIVDDVCEVFKAWEDGKKSNKLNFMFESKEASSLCTRFINIFKLKSLPGYKDVSSLTDARWAVLEYCNKKGFPLWSLKYNGCTTEMSELIDNITKVCDPNGLANQELIGKTASQIKNLELDLSMLLVSDSNFKSGFVSYVKSDEVARVQDDEFDEVYDYIKKHLQGEIGRWTENEVSNQVKNWRIEQTMTPPEPVQPVEPSPGPEPTPGIEDNPIPPKPEVREKAKKKIQELDESTLKNALDSLCDSESEYVIEILLKYVQ